LVHFGAEKGRLAGNHVIERRSQSVDIRADVNVLVALDLLGGDVVWSAEDKALFRLHAALVGHFASQAQIGQLGSSFAGENNIGRLNVPVHQVPPVRVL